MSVSYDFNSLYPSGQIDINRIWPKMQEAYPFKQYIANAVHTLFNSGRWSELYRSVLLTEKYHNPENLVF